MSLTPLPAETLGSLRRTVAARIRAGQRPGGTPDLDARLLVAAAASVDPTGVVARERQRPGPAVVERALAFAERRVKGEPVARIIGRQAFWGLDLALSPETLIPRPDTETVVEAALPLVRARAAARGCRILDLGTGSGAILLALLSEVPAATGVGVDAALGAARTARANAERLGLSRRAGFAVGDWAAAVGTTFDVVVANPPYIASAEIDDLAVEVRAFDPRLALDGGEDGLAAIRAVLADLARVLVDEGAAFIEIGAGQRGPAAAVARNAGFTTGFVRDIAGVDRVMVVTR